MTQKNLERLSEYLRALKESTIEGKIFVSSRDIATKAGFSADLVRKDLSKAGCFGKRGIGYNIDKLSDEICEILGTNRRWKVALVGFGQLGQSLINYKGFAESGFDITAIFEIDDKLIGEFFEDIPIYDATQMPDICERETILLAVVAVSTENSYKAIQRCFDAGIRGILNFTDRTGFIAPPHAKIRNVNIAIEMESLSYFITK
ncbi:redox-sensing transcriptional repressor Rex [bacterium]|nr:redox-sensing transcriptional repressor Rex [bacterium]